MFLASIESPTVREKYLDDAQQESVASAGEDARRIHKDEDDVSPAPHEKLCVSPVLSPKASSISSRKIKWNERTQWDSRKTLAMIQRLNLPQQPINSFKETVFEILNFNLPNNQEEYEQFQELLRAASSVYNRTMTRFRVCSDNEGLMASASIQPTLDSINSVIESLSIRSKQKKLFSLKQDLELLLSPCQQGLSIDQWKEAVKDRNILKPFMDDLEHADPKDVERIACEEKFKELDQALVALGEAINEHEIKNPKALQATTQEIRTMIALFQRKELISSQMLLKAFQLLIMPENHFCDINLIEHLPISSQEVQKYVSEKQVYNAAYFELMKTCHELRSSIEGRIHQEYAFIQQKLAKGIQKRDSALAIQALDASVKNILEKDIPITLENIDMDHHEFEEVVEAHFDVFTSSPSVEHSFHQWQMVFNQQASILDLCGGADYFPDLEQPILTFKDPLELAHTFSVKYEAEEPVPGGHLYKYLVSDQSGKSKLIQRFQPTLLKSFLKRSYVDENVDDIELFQKLLVTFKQMGKTGPVMIYATQEDTRSSAFIAAYLMEVFQKSLAQEHEKESVFKAPLQIALYLKQHENETFCNHVQEFEFLCKYAASVTYP